jgi:predicted DNA-binding WGR domain protein
MARPVKGVVPPTKDQEGIVTGMYYLECREGTSDKFYQIETRSVGHFSYHIRCLYGKIGTLGNEVWHLTNSSYEKVSRKFSDLYQSKLAKGYRLVEGKRVGENQPINKAKPQSRFARILDN